MGAIEAARAVVDPPRNCSRCRVCVWLDRLDDEDRGEAVALMAESFDDTPHSYVVQLLAEAAKNYDTLPTLNADNIGNHRRQGH